MSLWSPPFRKLIPQPRSHAASDIDDASRPVLGEKEPQDRARGREAIGRLPGEEFRIVTRAHGRRRHRMPCPDFSPPSRPPSACPVLSS